MRQLKHRRYKGLESGRERASNVRRESNNSSPGPNCAKSVTAVNPGGERGGVSQSPNELAGLAAAADAGPAASVLNCRDVHRPLFILRSGQKAVVLTLWGPLVLR